MLSNVGKDICSFYNLYRAMLLFMTMVRAREVVEPKELVKD